MKIREASLKDRKKITELYLDLYPFWKKKLKGKTVPLKSSIKKMIFVAEEENIVVGFCWANLVEYGICKFGYIEELFVEKDHRNKKIGRKLVGKIITEMKKQKVMALFVTTSRKNKNAQKLYKKMGFKGNGGPWFFWTPKKRKR